MGELWYQGLHSITDSFSVTAQHTVVYKTGKAEHFHSSCFCTLNPLKESFQLYSCMLLNAAAKNRPETWNECQTLWVCVTNVSRLALVLLKVIESQRKSIIFFYREPSPYKRLKIHWQAIGTDSKNSIMVVSQVTRTTPRWIMSSWLDLLLLSICALHPFTKKKKKIYIKLQSALL